MRIGLLGDVMLGRGVAETLRHRPPASLWSGELRRLALGCDLVVCNLECCISARGQPTRLVPRKPFFFRAPPSAVESLASIGVRAVSLANNHALDFGERALDDTLRLLSDAGIAAAGAGRGPSAARRGAIVEAAGVRVGLLAVTDHPAEYAAHGERLGVAHARLRSRLPARTADELERLSDAADVVIAFPHWGPNMATAPARWQRKRAAELLERGADLVAGHSAHVFHGVERHDGGPAVYDLGDALDDYAIDASLRNDLGLMAVWSPGGDPELELVGLRLRFAFTELAASDDADWIAARIASACAELGTDVERLDEQRFAVRA